MGGRSSCRGRSRSSRRCPLLSRALSQPSSGCPGTPALPQPRARRPQSRGSPEGFSRRCAPGPGGHEAILGAVTGPAAPPRGPCGDTRDSRHLALPDLPHQNPLHFPCQLRLSCLSATLLPPPQLQQRLQVGETAPRAARGIYSPCWNIKITSLIALELAQMALKLTTVYY